MLSKLKAGVQSGVEGLRTSAAQVSQYVAKRPVFAASLKMASWLGISTALFVLTMSAVNSAAFLAFFVAYLLSCFVLGACVAEVVNKWHVSRIYKALDAAIDEASRQAFGAAA